MDKRERLQATIKGEPADRVAVALWRHFPVDDQRPEDLAAATIEFQALYDFDFVKVTPASSFCVRDWGATDEWQGNPEGTRHYTQRPVSRPDDWLKLKPLDPRNGSLGGQLGALELIHKGLPADTPFIQTIFSPVSQARNLVGPDYLMGHLRQHPGEVKIALETMTETTIRFIEEAKHTGVDGIFYAVQFASTRVMSEAEYHEFGEPFDRKILEAARDLWLNVLHLHGEEVMFDLVAGYGAQIVNWHDRETPPSLAAGAQKTGGAVCGGLRQWETMVRGTPNSVRAEAQAAVVEMNGRRLVLGTGCVTPITAPRANLRAARDAVV